MIYLLGLLISLTAGLLFIRVFASKRLEAVLHLLLALSLGLGLVGTSAFYVHILLNQFNRFIPVAVVLSGTLVSFFIKPFSLPQLRMTKAHALGLLVLGLIAVPLAVCAHYYPFGGWDAWSCWNLKAKFIFLGHEHWKEVLAPSFWRSNTQYPLLWPLINVWFWDLGGKFSQAVPMLNSVVIALLTAGVLFFGLLELTGRMWPNLLAVFIIMAVPFNIILYASQYSDSLLGLYLLSSFLCLLLAEKYNEANFRILSMVFLGLMSFAKDEGLAAAVIAAFVIYWHLLPKKNGVGLKAFWKDNGKLIFWFIVAALPTVIFKLFLAPKNVAFINGLVSADKPTDWARLAVIAVYPWFEFISAKWGGFWLLAAGGILLAGKKLWRTAAGTIGLTLVFYLGVVLAYYALNTYFEIGWWMSTTLSRILFALLPTVVLWIGYGLET
ncbi:MAG: hypothetical protein KGJ09_03815 [Candidatus Omnitrophica bacterium]|nr:hypothetical protein [Candidatus Omnitrophota bacterium]MDE2009187.1 hypothetical protein [Candidatus Omnitrophota bacterium]MDE2213708.1 hypothetical protein [Candidatus Omnitrophota bacterium]MDE2230717.1 hypothetical protein [Candidatus Omnitrophota bacterium]